MALEINNVTDEQLALLLERSALIATQIDAISETAVPDTGDFAVKDTHPEKNVAAQISQTLRNFVTECMKEVSYKETGSQRLFAKEAGWDHAQKSLLGLSGVLIIGHSGDKQQIVKLWNERTVPFLESIVAPLDDLPFSVAGKPNIFFPDSDTSATPWKDSDNIPGMLGGKNILREGLYEFLEEAKRFLNSFGNSYFLRRRIAPPPGVTDVGANIPTDMTLQTSLVPEGGWPLEATHYISSMQRSPTGDDSFLPVRLAPHDHPTPLAGGWDDLNFMYLDADGKLTNSPRSGAANDNGIDLVSVGDPFRVTEVVVGRSGIWVGLGAVQSEIYALPATFTVGPNGHARTLYTRPEYLRKIHREQTQAGDIQIDPVLAYTLMPYNNESPRAKIPDGLKLVKPGDNLNWKKLGYGDVQLTYFNFNDYNKKNIPTQTGKLQLKNEDLIAYPRLRFSEGYYYFIAIDGKRKTVGDLLNEMSPSSNDASAQLEEAKENEAIQMIRTLREKALNMILEYTGKAVNVQDEKYLALRDLYTVNVAQALHQGGASNMKVLFALPAQIIDALPDNPNPYYDNITSTSDFYSVFSSGRDYTFTIKISDIKKVSEGLVKLLTSIKEKLASFTSEGGVIQNANSVKYNIESQIERIKTFPITVEEFLIRQTSGQSGKDALTQHLVEGLKIPGDAFLQFGLRDNGQIGPDVRQTISFMLYSPDPALLKRADKKELITLDPFVTDKELSGVMSRSGIILKKALPWMRDKFLDAEGCRTLHYFMAHRNLIQFGESAGRDLRMNEWIKFLQSYTVPPLMIKLSKERSQSAQEIDCKKLVEDLLNSGTIVTEQDKVLRELVENNCGEAYLKAVLKDTSAMDPESSKKAIHMKQLLTKNISAYGDAFGIDLLTDLYQGFLHKLDPQGLIALLLACLSHKLGVSFTAEALCEVAIQKLIESVGVEEMKKQLVEWIPGLAIYFPELQQIAIEQKLGMSMPAGASADGPALYDSALKGEDFSEQFAAHFGDITNQEMFAQAPIAAAMTLSPNPIYDYSVYDSIARMERMGRFIPIIAPLGQTIENIASQKSFYLDKGFSSHEADAALVRDGVMIVQPSFIESIKNPQSVNLSGGVESVLDHLTHLDDHLSNIPPNPSDANHVSWGPFGNTNQNMANVANAAEQAKEFVAYLKQVINLQELCEKIVGPLLQAPGLLFADPNDFSNAWENWADGLKDSLVRHFQFPDLNIPTMRMPDNLTTDDLIGSYAKMLLQVLAAMIGMILGEILNLILLELLERCFDEPDGDEARNLSAPSPTSTIPLPMIGEIVSGLPDGETAPDFAAWLRDITNFLSNDQLCSLLLQEATDNTIKMVLDRTKDMWPDVWNAGIDNSADIQTMFADLGARMQESGGLEICNAIRATTPILVSACEADYDYDARCSELQLQGLTKKECDEVIRQEINDLKNKIMGLSSMLFPDQNILQGALPEPCGENGYFMLPSVMEDTMARVTDNILQAVKTSLIGDMSSLKFFSTPPRSLVAHTDPEELKKVYGLVYDAMQGRHEIECVMPICHNPMEIFADAAASRDSWEEVLAWTPAGLAKKGLIPLVYSSRGLRALDSMQTSFSQAVQGEFQEYGYINAGFPGLFDTDAAERINSTVEQGFLDAMHRGPHPNFPVYSKAAQIKYGKEIYKALPDFSIEKDTRKPLSVDKPTYLYTIGDVFSSSGIHSILGRYASNLQLVGWIPNGPNNWSQLHTGFQGGKGVSSLPGRFYKVLGKKRASKISTLFYEFGTTNPTAEGDLLGSVYKELEEILVDFSGIPNEAPVNWKIQGKGGETTHSYEFFHKIAKNFSVFSRKQVISSGDPNEKASPIAHEYVLSAEEYTRCRALKVKDTKLYKYLIPYRLDWPLRVLLPGGYASSTGENPFPIGKDKTTQETLDKFSSIIQGYAQNGKNPSTAFAGLIPKTHVASTVFFEILASYIGVSSSNLNPRLLLSHRETEKDDGTGISNSIAPMMHLANLDEPDYAALRLLILGGSKPGVLTDDGVDAVINILGYANGDDDTFVNAFLNMPIGEALGITKQNLRSILPDFLSLYENIEEGGVYFDLVPAELGVYQSVKFDLEDVDGAGYTADSYEALFKKLLWFGGLQLRPVAVGFKNFFRDTDNAFETLKPEDVIPRLSTRPTSPKLSKAFDEPTFHPVFPKFLYIPMPTSNPGATAAGEQTYASTLAGLAYNGTSSKNSYYWTNFNPDVSYFPMPFKNPLAVPRVKAMTEKIINTMTNLEFDAIGKDSVTITDRIRTSNLDNVLLYQEYTLNPFYNDLKTSAGIAAALKSGHTTQIKDDYKISKSKLLSRSVANSNSSKINAAHSTNYKGDSPIIEKQIRDPEFNFEFVEDFDKDVYVLLEQIGLKDMSDLVEYSNKISYVNPRAPAGLALSWAKRTFPENMRTPDIKNSRSMIFSKLMVSKLESLSSKYAASPLQSSTSPALRALGYSFATSEYSACKFAYTSKIFGKLRLSRLNQRKYMKKLWSKVLKTPINSTGNPQCKRLIDKLTASTQADLANTETDFFNIDSIKPEVMEFYRNSVCRDVYESSGDVYTASQRALAEAALILLVRVYCLEMCFAGIISWDAYDLSDVFKEPIVKKLLIKNMKSEINNFDIIINFANDYLRKQENIKSTAAHVMVSNSSGLEYIIEAEADNINRTIASIFTNSKPISTKLSLNTVTSEEPELTKALERMFSSPKAALQTLYPASKGVFPKGKNLQRAEAVAYEIRSAANSQEGAAYPAVNYLTDNIYTHNYSDGTIQNRYNYNPVFSPANCKIFSTKLGGPMGPPVDGDSIVALSAELHSPDSQDFSGLAQDLSQRNFLHSVPLNYYPSATMNSYSTSKELLTDTTAGTWSDLENKLIYSGDYGPGRPDGNDPSSKPDAFYEYMRHYVDICGTEKLINDDWVVDAPGGEDTSLSVLNSIIWVEEKIKRTLSSKLLCDPGQMINQHEYLAGNLVNSHLGNFIMQPYVRLTDQDDDVRAGFKSRSSFGNPVEPCAIDDIAQGNIAEALTEIGSGPVLSNTRSENNPFKAWIYDVVPLSVFSWFMTDSFIPWINKEGNEKIKLLYNDHGFKPFFKEVKFGMRLVYVSQFGPLAMTDTVGVMADSDGMPYDGSPNVQQQLKDSFGVGGLKNAKAGLVSRTYFIEDEQKEEGWLLTRGGPKPGIGGGYYFETNKHAQRIPLLFNELHIPVVEIEKDINVSNGHIRVAGISTSFDDFCYTNKVSFLGSTQFGNNPTEAYNTAKSYTVKDFFKQENKEMYKCLTQTPSNFYFKHIADGLLQELQSSPEFKLLFQHLFPIRRYMALGFLYSSDAILDFIGEPTDVLDRTKATILSILDNLESSNDYTFIPPAVKNQMVNDIAAGLRGTNIKQPNLSKQILEIIWKCLLMILKGFVELTDPAIITAKSVLDVAKLVYDTIIIGIEMGLQITKQTLQQTIDTAKSSMMQVEVNLAIIGPSTQMSLDTLKTAAEKAQQAGVEPDAANFETEGPAIKSWNIEGDDPSLWSIDVTLSYTPDESLAAPWSAFSTAAATIQESLVVYQTAKTAVTDAEKEMKELIADFEAEFKKVKDEMDSIFGASWLLPATWAAFMPSMIPLGGGIIPPPFFVGPPSTIPGMIYLALLLSDAYEEEEAANLAESKDPNCDDEL